MDFIMRFLIICGTLIGCSSLSPAPVQTCGSCPTGTVCCYVDVTTSNGPDVKYECLKEDPQAPGTCEVPDSGRD